MDNPHEVSEERRFVGRVLIVLAIASLFFLAWYLRNVLLMLFGAVVIASIFRAIADMLRHWLRLPDSVAVAFSVLIVFGVIGGLGMLFGSQVSQQVQTLGDALPAAWKSFEARIGEFGPWHLRGPAHCLRPHYRAVRGVQRRRSSVFDTTLTLENAMAAPATTGLSSPAAASGMPTTL